jgi:hypothetical protein
MKLWCLAVIAGALIGCSGAPEQRSTPEPEIKTQPPNGVKDRTDVVGNAPSGAFVRLEPQFAHQFPPPPGEGFIDQSGQMFVPGAITAQAGQAVKFRSSEDILHNVRVIRAEDKVTIFNVATPPWGAYTHTFDKAGTYDVTCDIHTAMKATILVSDTPYATIADDNGGFTFVDVVPGAYKIIAFSGENEVERNIEIRGSRIEVTVP